MNSDVSNLIVCESALDPLLQQLATVLDEHDLSLASPVAEAVQRLRAAAADTSVTISAAILESLGPIPPRRRWALVQRDDPIDAQR
jgi:hypothetical protein